MNTENQQDAVLMAHCDTNKVTREELALIPTPNGTDSFKPVSHIELVNSLEAVLASRGMEVRKEQFAVRSDGSKLFGTFDLSLAGLDEGSGGSLGFRTANDRTMKIQIMCGVRIFVCDNMAFSGGSIILNRKHTAGLDLLPELMGAVTKFEAKYTSFTANLNELKGLALTSEESKALIFDVFHQQIMPIKYMRPVAELYFGAHREEYGNGTAYTLHNCFTEVAQDMFLNRRMLAMQAVGELFGI